MPEGDKKLTPPPVYWAQRNECILLNVGLEDCAKPEITITKDKVHFHGKGGTDMKDHEVTLELYESINPEQSKYVTRPRGTEFILVKLSDQQKYWPRLLKEKTKFHWLKIDFNKWKDEDESDNEASPGPGAGGPAGMGGMGGMDFESLMAQMGGLGADPSGELDDLPDDEEDDDDDHEHKKSEKINDKQTPAEEEAK